MKVRALSSGEVGAVGFFYSGRAVFVSPRFGQWFVSEMPLPVMLTVVVRKVLFRSCKGRRENVPHGRPDRLV